MCGRRLGEYTRFQTVTKEHVVHAKAGDCLVINNHKNAIKPALKIMNLNGNYLNINIRIDGIRAHARTLT